MCIFVDWKRIRSHPGRPKQVPLKLISSEVTLPLQVTDLTLEVKQESRAALDYQSRMENAARDLFEAREQN